jgi:hypothetical protein
MSKVANRPVRTTRNQTRERSSRIFVIDGMLRSVVVVSVITCPATYLSSDK